MTTIAFLGDIALIGDYNKLYKQKINPFKEISNVLKKSDYVIGNLEALCEGEQGENYDKKPRLKIKAETLNFLNNINLNLATLAHNHIYDNLQDGFNKTINFLLQNNIDYLGAGITKEQSEKTLIKSINGIKFCFLNYVTLDTNPNLPYNSRVYLNYANPKKIKEDIKKNRDLVNYIIVLLHWGGRVEGGNYPDNNQPTLAKQIIDFGADLIVGHHSHTLQPFEIYKGRYIFYSLGNFCFADFESDGIIKKLDKKRRTNSIILRVNFNLESYIIDCDFIKNDNLFIKLDPNYLRVYKNRNRLFKLINKYKIIWFIYFLKVKYYYRLIRVIQNRILVKF